MRTGLLDSALPPLSEPRRRSPLRRLGAAVSLFFQSLDEALAAERRYEQLVASGVPKSTAVRVAFDETFGVPHEGERMRARAPGERR